MLLTQVENGHNFSTRIVNSYIDNNNRFWISNIINFLILIPPSQRLFLYAVASIPAYHAGNPGSILRGYSNNILIEYRRKLMLYSASYLTFNSIWALRCWKKIRGKPRIYRWGLSSHGPAFVQARIKLVYVDVYDGIFSV